MVCQGFEKTTYDHVHRNNDLYFSNSYVSSLKINPFLWKEYKVIKIDLLTQTYLLVLYFI